MGSDKSVGATQGPGSLKQLRWEKCLVAARSTILETHVFIVAFRIPRTDKSIAWLQF